MRAAVLADMADIVDSDNIKNAKRGTRGSEIYIYILRAKVNQKKGYCFVQYIFKFDENGFFV